MGLTKCHTCGLVMDRTGEKRPSVKCKQCKDEHCSQCAKVTVEFCAAMKGMGRSLWECSECEAKGDDMKSVIASMKSIQKELGSINDRQAKQEEDRKQILDGLKAVETVVKKMDKIESVQEDHEDRLTAQELAKQKSDDRMEEGLKRLEEVEKKLNDGSLPNKNDGARDIRLTNAVVREVREIEKRDKNFMIWNIPESTEETDEERKKHDEGKVIGVLRELKMEDVSIKDMARMGEKGGRFPRKIRVIVTSADDCKRVLQKSESGQLSNDVRLSRDKTFNERQEARLFWLEKDESQKDGFPAADTQGGGVRGGRGGGVGGSRGRSRGRGPGRRGGRGGSARGAVRTESRKRRNSGGDVAQPETEDDENKRRRVGQDSAESSLGPSTSASILAPAKLQTLPTPSLPQVSSVPPSAEASATPPQVQPQSAKDRLGTPHSILSTRAKEDQQSF